MFSLRMKLNNVIGKDEQVILENIRRCKRFSGKTFKVIKYCQRTSISETLEIE